MIDTSRVACTVLSLVGFSYVYHVKSSRGDDFALVSSTD